MSLRTSRHRVLLGVLPLVAAASGCAGQRAAGRLQPNPAEACAAAIPVARATVMNRGRLVLIRTRRPEEQVPGHSSECLLVYDGPYAAGSVTGATNAGRYAVIITTVRHPRVVAVTVTNVRPR